MYADLMRTTVSLDDDVVAAVARVRAERGIGLSDALNDLVRRGLAMRTPQARAGVLPTAPLGLRVDVSNIGEALDYLEGPAAR